MRFFFPDSQDQVDPSFDFEGETRNPLRIRQRDDRYAHEILTGRPYDGMLISKPQVDGTASSGGRYTRAMRNRFYREGVHRFLRLERPNGDRLLAMGDNGAFSYVDADVPPVTPDEVIDFYEFGGFDLGFSVDHAILGYEDDGLFPGDVDEVWKYRHALTLELASEFRRRHSQRRCRFTPVGVAQGWSALSYAEAVSQLQEMGYRFIALGGMVPLKTRQILACLREIATVLEPGVEVHLLGVTRTESMPTFASYGVTSFDSTSPFRRAFMDERDNYWTPGGNYVALRVPQVDGNPKLKRRIKAGQVDQELAIELEQRCLSALRKFDSGEGHIAEAVDALVVYEELWDGEKNRGAEYRRFLEEAPWRSCDCGICGEVGIEIAVFRGAERNKRRGFHNVWVFANEMRETIEQGGRR